MALTMKETLENLLNKKGSETHCPVAVIMRNDSVLMGHRHYTADKWKDISVWTIPGGRCDKGETIEQTLRREVFEETGIKNLVVKEFVQEVPGAKEGDIVLIFTAETAEEATLMEPEKFSEWKWFKADQIPDAFINPKTREVIIGLLNKGNGHFPIN
jgi:8-oxo-dGTP diphosphatase